MKEIWNSELMNALRLQHLENGAGRTPSAVSCGQLSHCLPDNIDAHRPALLAKFKEAVHLDSAVHRAAFPGVAVTEAAA